MKGPLEFKPIIHQCQIRDMPIEESSQSFHLEVALIGALHTTIQV